MPTRTPLLSSAIITCAVALPIAATRLACLFAWGDRPARDFGTPATAHPDPVWLITTEWTISWAIGLAVGGWIGLWYYCRDTARDEEVLAQDDEFPENLGD